MSTLQADKKLYKFGEEAQSELSEGIKKGAEVVASTLGPAGSNVLIERKYRTPIMVDDGITALQNLILDNELQNLGITSLIDAAQKTSEHAGDGTSTTVVLTEAIYNAGRKLAGDGILMFGKTPFEIKNAIFSAKDIVLEKLKELSKKVENKEDIRAVAYAAYADEKMADVVANLVEKVGENGMIIVEEAWGRETEVELLTGMKFAGKLAHGFFANTPEEGLNLDGFPILITDFDFVNLNDLMSIVKELSQAGEQGLIVIANKYERTAIEQIIKVNLYNTQNKSSFKIYLVRTPSFTPGQFEDLAIFVSARYFSKEKNDKVVECVLGELGRVNTFKVSKIGEAIAIGGAGDKLFVDTRIKELKLKQADEKVKMIKGVIEQRIASLAAAIGIIKVGSPSDGETEHIRLKTKNAVKSAQAAVAEGIVKGGGLALKEIGESLAEDNILKEVLKVPYDIIQRNARGKLEIPEELYDATKIIRTAIEQACSTSWLLINTKTIIAHKSEPDRGDAAKIIADKLDKGTNKKDY